ncbi:XRE family transcriptional regulator [Saccharopolyspora gloriosae]|uniref:XRE family transcriptional regulator n=1 Tax=Saccharopolyspora gloriosae TaxID=455344 RepID=UPI001FB75DD2|nr:XRE family transcriptional regulator [Saccharopolyspora gloriosae]
MPEANEPLRRARERVESPNASGESLTRQELAELVNAWIYENTGATNVAEIDANYIGKLEQGKIRWPQDEQRRAALRVVLGVATDSELGLRRPRREPPREMGVNRQTFLRTVGAGAAAVGSARVIDMFAFSEPTPVPSVVGASEVAEVRAIAQTFGTWDARYGGGFVREAVMAQLRFAVQLLNVRCSERTRGELLSAVGYLGHVTGFMAFDAYAHDDARRMFRFALSCAEEVGDWHLRAKILSSMARQSIWCGDPDSGLTFAEMALVRSDRLTGTEQAMLHTARARALGKLRRSQDTVMAVGNADDAYARAEPANDPPWMAYYDGAQHAGDTGHALWELAIQGRFVTDAATRLETAVRQHGEAAARSRAISQTKLASLIMVTGDPLEAATLGGGALEAATPLKSHRAADDLRALSGYASAHRDLGEVTALRGRIEAAVATV